MGLNLRGSLEQTWVCVCVYVCLCACVCVRALTAVCASTELGSSESACSSVGAEPSLRGGRLAMRTTLALLHLALVWSREALTLSDLLR